MPYNNSPAKKYGPLTMDHGPKMKGPLTKMQKPPLLMKCGSKRYKGKKK